MARRGDLDLIHRAQRAGIFARIRDAERLGERDAEHRTARWEREAEATGRSRSEATYWDDAWRWIEAERTRG